MRDTRAVSVLRMSAELPPPRAAAGGRRDAATAVDTPPTSPSFDSVVTSSATPAAPAGRGKVVGWVVGLAIAIVVGIGAYAVLGGGSDDDKADDANAGTSASLARGDAASAALRIEGSVGQVQLSADAPADQLLALAATGADAAAQAAEGSPAVATLSGETSTVKVAADAEWSFVLDVQTDTVAGDLSAARVKDLQVVAGTRSVDVHLGEPTGTSVINLEAGLGSFLLTVPEGVAVKVEVSGGAGQVMIDDVTENSVTSGSSFTTKDFDESQPHYLITVPSGVGTLMVHHA